VHLGREREINLEFASYLKRASLSVCVQALYASASVCTDNSVACNTELTLKHRQQR